MFGYVDVSLGTYMFQKARNVIVQNKDVILKNSKDVESPSLELGHCPGQLAQGGPG